MTRELTLVAIGGAAGAVLRYLTDLAVHAVVESPDFFTGIFTANMIGCLIIGYVYARVERKHHPEPMTRLFLLVGVIGSYTTYSAFALEGLMLMSLSLVTGLFYISLQAAAGILCVWLGGASFHYLNRQELF